MKVFGLMFVGLLFALVTCAVRARDVAPIPSVAQTVARSSNTFAVNLYQRLAAGEQKNLFFSPSSIHTALAMALTGARGQTASQMREAMDWPSDDPAVTAAAFHSLLNELKPGKNAHYELHSANSLWGQKGYDWKANFLKLTKEEFLAPLREVDYQTAADEAGKQINAWVEKETHDKIKDLIKPGALNADTRLVLANAIYFKGTWARQFSKDATQDADFRTGGKTVKVPMMFQKARFGYADDDEAQVLSMPYKGNELSMVIVLPKKDDGLADLTKGMTSAKLEARMTRLRMQEAMTYVPRFKMTSEFGLGSTLQAMGMKDAFAPGTADFSGMDGKRDLFISAALHKAFVDVNEEGTEAAAATGLVVGITAVRVEEPPVTFKADHPFLFVIRHNITGAILFLGQVVDPK
ncbi:MAG: serpin family protein [Planctomycetaceae bacterium]|nr:serpin family protein [Planctomycetaceae bacterium]